MTDDQSRRPDPSLNPDEPLNPDAPNPDEPPADELPAEELPTDELPAEELPADALPAEPLPAAEAEAPSPEPHAAPAPERGRAAATGPARAPKATNAKGARDVGYRGSLPPRNDRIARPWVITVIAIFVLIFVLAIAGLPSRLLPDATPAPIPSFSLEPLPSSSAISSPQ